MRALFATKKASTSKTGQHKISENGAPRGVDALETILSLGMPKLLPDADYVMDVFTAASLNSESLQRYVSGGASESGGAEKSPTEITSLINAFNVHKWTPLMYAAYLGHKETSHMLLSRGANPEARNESGQTSLMMAASCGSADIVDILLRFSARINEQDQYGRAPLHYAVKYNQAKITELLLNRGADPNLPDMEDMTPTLMACEVGNENTVVTLLKYKGDANRWNKQGENGPKLAFDHPKILMLLQQNVPLSIIYYGEDLGQYYQLKRSASERSVVTTTASANVVASANNDATPAEFDVILQLLHELGLEKYEQNFAENKVVRLDEFGALTDEALTRMGITLLGPKKKLLDAAAHYRQHGKFASDSRDNSPTSVKKSDEPKSAHADLTQLGADLRECQTDFERLSQSCTLQAHALLDCKQLQAQTYLLLTQLSKSQQIDAIAASNIKTLLSTMEQMDARLTKLLSDTK